MILRYLDRRDCVAVAQVCHRLWDAAAPIIWQSLPSRGRTTHLLNLLPKALKDLLDCEKHLSLEVSRYASQILSDLTEPA